jgi:hypothetical protein
LDVSHRVAGARRAIRSKNLLLSDDGFGVDACGALSHALSTNMKKLAIIVATASLALSAPVFACPHEEGAAPKTAEKKKDEKGTQDKAKEQPKKEEAAPTTAKKKEEPKQDTTKKPEKVSQK